MKATSIQDVNDNIMILIISFATLHYQMLPLPVYYCFYN